MSLQGHVDELSRRHKFLEKQIEAEKSHAAHDRLKVIEMKRKKLQLKDEMERLRP